MLWKVRAALPDRPGALAALATACGSAGVNILGMQIFPGVDDVTDEIVLDLPRGWSGSETQRLLHDAGCRFVSASPCSEAALVDQATRYVHAARTVLAEPARFPEVVAALFDAEASAPRFSTISVKPMSNSRATAAASPATPAARSNSSPEGNSRSDIATSRANCASVASS